jgi:uncharacterized oxidoreductase
MKLTGNTVLITGGGSGIGRGLAEALHQRKNQVIIAGRRKDRLAEVAGANPGMAGVELNIEDPASISAVTRKLTVEYPTLNVLINNAGVMHIDDVSSAVDETLLVSTLTTNLMGTIRITGALIEHFKRQPHATVINNTSVLGFVPMANAAVYSATKAALHSYTMSLRYKLKETPVRLLELAPPWVRADLLGSNNEPRAMPLADFIEETMHVLGSDADEVLVERAKPLRNNVGPNEFAVVTQFNDMMSNSR